MDMIDEIDGPDGTVAVWHEKDDGLAFVGEINKDRKYDGRVMAMETKLKSVVESQSSPEQETKGN
jgi:hypothetical protein